MSKIELTQEEIDLIQKYLNGELGMFSATEEEQGIFIPVIDKAEALMFELNAAEEIGTDLIKWFWKKHKKQNKNS